MNLTQVCDLAEGHLSAIHYLSKQASEGKPLLLPIVIYRYIVFVSKKLQWNQDFNFIVLEFIILRYFIIAHVFIVCYLHVIFLLFCLCVLYKVVERCSIVFST